MTKNQSEIHNPVMLQRCIELLAPGIQGSRPVIIDCTLGLGGHTEALLAAHPSLTVIGIDRDPVALAKASERLAQFGDRFIPAAAVFDQIDDVLAANGFTEIHGVLFDLGVSSMQLDEADRGFAYSQAAELDMRMDQSVGETAAQLLARLDEPALLRILREFGEERFAPQIAKALVANRGLITTSKQLNDLVSKIVPVIPGKTTGHPAKRVYQALRIAVNDELGAIERSLPQAIAALAPGARIVVMSYHSLEDAIVKKVLQTAASSSTPLDMPFEIPGSGPILKILTKGVERASEIELEQNPRAASARLRAAEKMEQK